MFSALLTQPLSCIRRYQVLWSTDSWAQVEIKERWAASTFSAIAGACIEEKNPIYRKYQGRTWQENPGHRLFIVRGRWDLNICQVHEGTTRPTTREHGMHSWTPVADWTRIPTAMPVVDKQFRHYANLNASNILSRKNFACKEITNRLINW